MPGPFQRNRLLAMELKDGWLDGVAGMIVASGRKLAQAPIAKAA
jgi:predicted N-acetyltransferase YhbS